MLLARYVKLPTIMEAHDTYVTWYNILDIVKDSSSIAADEEQEGYI